MVLGRCKDRVTADADHDGDQAEREDPCEADSLAPVELDMAEHEEGVDEYCEGLGSRCRSHMGQNRNVCGDCIPSRSVDKLNA